MSWLYESNKQADREFQEVEHWLNMLKSENSRAIQHLYSKCNKQISHLAKSYKLSNEDTEELICDCMVLFIQKLQSNEYSYQGWDPISYVIEIAKFKSRNYYRRSIKHSPAELTQMESSIPDQIHGGSIPEVEIEIFLSKLDENCQKLIRLKYLDELRDKDIIDLKLTQYSNINSLKNHRSKCMKKLIEIADLANK